MQTFVRIIATELCAEFDERDASRVIRTYNRVQENEHDGADYIFNLYNRDDVLYVLKGVIDLATLYDLQQQSDTCDALTSYFIITDNGAPRLLTHAQVRSQVLTEAAELAEYVLRYPWLYKDIYESCVVPHWRLNYVHE